MKCDWVSNQKLKVTRINLLEMDPALKDTMMAFFTTAASRAVVLPNDYDTTFTTKVV